MILMTSPDTVPVHRTIRSQAASAVRKIHTPFTFIDADQLQTLGASSPTNERNSLSMGVGAAYWSRSDFEFNF